MLRLSLLALLLAIAMATENEGVADVEETVDIDTPVIGLEEGTDLEKKSIHYCYYRGQVIMNGRTTNNPYDCKTYTCRNGRVLEQQNQCKHNGRCIPLDRSYTDKCTTYRCERQRDRYNGIQFVVRPVSSKCIDAHGNCRRQGERFPHVVNNTYRKKCTCRVSIKNNQVKTKYRC